MALAADTIRAVSLTCCGCSVEDIFSLFCKGVHSGRVRALKTNVMSRSSIGFEGSPGILIADSDVFARNFLSRALSREGYYVMSASNCEEAIRLSDNCDGQIRLLLFDSDLPGSTAVAECVRNDHPDARVLIISAQ